MLGLAAFFLLAVLCRVVEMTENSLQSGGVAGADAAWIDGINLYDEFDQIRRQTAHVGTVDEQYKIAIAHPLSRIYRIANAVANDATLLEAVAAAAKIKITKRAEKNLHYTLIKALFPEERSSGTFTDYANALKRAASWGFTYEDARGYLQAHGPYSLRDGRHRPDSVPADSGSTERKAKKAGPGSKANDDAPAVPSNQDGEATAAAPSDGVVSPAVNTAPATAAAVKALPLAVCGTDSISGPVVNPPQRHQGASKQGLGFGQLYGSKYQGRKAGATLEVLLDENGHFVISEVISYYTFEAVKPIPDLKPAASQSQDDHHQAPCFDTDESPDDNGAPTDEDEWENSDDDGGSTTEAVNEPLPPDRTEQGSAAIQQPVTPADDDLETDMEPDRASHAATGGAALATSLPDHRAQNTGAPAQKYDAVVLAALMDIVKTKVITSVHKAADALNGMSIPTVRGGIWHGAQVLTILKRYGYPSITAFVSVHTGPGSAGATEQPNLGRDDDDHDDDDPHGGGGRKPPSTSTGDPAITSTSGHATNAADLHPDDAQRLLGPAASASLWHFDGSLLASGQARVRNMLKVQIDNAVVSERLDGNGKQIIRKRTRPTMVRFAVVNGKFYVRHTMGINEPVEQMLRLNGWIVPDLNYDHALKSLEVSAADLDAAFTKLAGRSTKTEDQPQCVLQGNYDGLRLSNAAGEFVWLPNARRLMEDGSVPECPITAIAAASAANHLVQQGAPQ